MISIIKTADYKHKVVFDNTYDSMDIKVCKYRDWNNGSPDTDNLIVNVTGKTSDYTINLSDTAYRQGVYVASITEHTGGISIQTDYMLYDFTELFTCYKSLINTIFISSVDEECGPCDADFAETDKLARLELNKILLLLGQLVAFVDPVSASTFGLFNTSASKSDYEKYVGDIEDKLNEVTARCNDCD